MITLKRCSAAEADKIVKDPEIFERISEDDTSINLFSSPADDRNYYLMINDGEKNIGLWILHPENKTTLRIHCNILQEYRSIYKYECGRLILQWFLDNAPDNFQKINCQIPAVYPEVYYYTMKNGFIEEGVNRRSCLKGGELVDQYILGITREEIAEHLKEVKK